ncbi:PaaI family thioesterase [Streptomyces flaveolus]|uniref:PaaI family thioesterase n=1 Tax=Streptomyces flaveolus TaxID=67297 RepID=UPI0034220549
MPPTPATTPTTEELLAAMPHTRHLGIVLDTAAPDEVRGHLDWAPHLTTLGGTLHGGALMTLADSTAAVCAYLNLPPGAATTTVESGSRFFHGLREGTVQAVSRPLHTGRRLITVQTDLYDTTTRRRIARTTQTQAVLPPTPEHRPPGHG